MEDMMYDSDCSEYSQNSEESQSGDDTPFLDEAVEVGSSKKKAAEYKVLDQPTLKDMQSKAISSVISILGCKTSVARALCICFRWEPEAIFGTVLYPNS